MRRIEGLDGIRMIAVSAVVVSHFFESSQNVRELHLGHFGVMLFFILSGFLISSIILKQKIRGLPLQSFLKQFYVRRTLRIFPLFYLSILVFSIFGKGFGDFLGWHLGYASNFLLAKEGSGFLGTHFWSLAVEEQFYLIFPLFLFTCKPRWESAIIAGLICMGMLSRCLFWNVDSLNSNFDRLLTTNLDCLGLGAALALSKIRAHSDRLVFLLCAAYLTIAISLCNGLTSVHAALISMFAMSIAWVDRHQDARLIQFLELKPIRYIGQISYGLYVWHYLLWQNKIEFEPWCELLNSVHPILQYGHSERVIIGTLSLVLSIISWEFFEKQILTLKHRISYS